MDLSTPPPFSARSGFPSFLCTAPSSAQQPWVPAKRSSHFNWTWVGLVGNDSGHCERRDLRLREEPRRTGGCGAFSQGIRGQDRGIHSTPSAVASSPASSVPVTTSTLGPFGRRM